MRHCFIPLNFAPYSYYYCLHVNFSFSRNPLQALPENINSETLMLMTRGLPFEEGFNACCSGPQLPNGSDQIFLPRSIRLKLLRCEGISLSTTLRSSEFFNKIPGKSWPIVQRSSYSSCIQAWSSDWEGF